MEKGGSEYHMYNGVGSTGPTNTYPDGTQLEEASEEKRVNECAKACRNFVSPAGKNAKGFLVNPNGRCFCSAFLADYGTPINNDYTGYDFVGDETTVVPRLLQSATFCTNQVAMDYIQNSSPQACAEYCYSIGQTGFFINHAGEHAYACKCSTDSCKARYSSKYDANSYSVSVVNTDKGDLDSAYHAVKPHLQQEAGTCNMPRYKLKASGNVCVGKPSYTHKGGGICMALGVRVFAGSSDNPGTNAESYTLWCARACSYREPPDGYGPWSNQGDAVGFSGVRAFRQMLLQS